MLCDIVSCRCLLLRPSVILIDMPLSLGQVGRALLLNTTQARLDSRQVLITSKKLCFLELHDDPGA